MRPSDLVSKWIVSVAGGMAVVFAVYFYFDTTYFKCAEAAAMEAKVIGAMEKSIKSQSAMFEKQMNLLDLRQLEQLRTSKALLENEIRRSPNDHLLRQQLEIINAQIKQIQERLYQ